MGRRARMVKRVNPITRALDLQAVGIFRLLVVTTALLCGVVALGGASTAMLQGLYSGWKLERSHSLTVYLPPETEATVVTQLTESLPTLQGVTGVKAVAPQEVQGWLGPVGASGNLPLPTVLEVGFDDKTEATPIVAHIQQTYPMAEVDDHQPLLQQVSGAVRGVQVALVGLGGVMLALMMLLMTLTTRTGLQAQFSTLHLLVQLGATDGALAKSVCGQVLGRTLVGYGMGVSLGAMILASAARVMPGVAAHMSVAVWVVLLVVPLLLPLVATVSAGWTARRLLSSI